MISEIIGTSVLGAADGRSWVTARTRAVGRISLLFAALSIGAAIQVADAADDEIKPAIIYDGHKFDKSFLEAMSVGADAFTKRTGVKVNDVEVTSASQREQFLRQYATKGFSPVLATSFLMTTPLATVAKEFPKTHFTIIDAVVDQPNVQSIVFREHEGSFLVGMLAALKTKTGKIGFVGGMDVPLIRKFECGYEQGAKYVNPKIEILQNMTGTTVAAFDDPIRGGELAKTQIESGADVVYAAAGGTGIGVYQVVADAGKLAIGVNSNQDYLHPGNMLTSMLKRVDLATDRTFTQAKNGTWKPGVQVLGLADDGVGFSVDEFNQKLLTPDILAKADAARKGIIDGSIKVHDYTSDGSCPK